MTTEIPDVLHFNPDGTGAGLYTERIELPQAEGLVGPLVPVTSGFVLNMDMGARGGRSVPELFEEEGHPAPGNGRGSPQPTRWVKGRVTQEGSRRHSPAPSRPSRARRLPRTPSVTQKCLHSWIFGRAEILTH